MSRLLEVTCKFCMSYFACYDMLQVDYGRGTKAAGYYVQYPSGLFLAPLPQTDYDRMPEVETLFRCVGTLFAKCIQDGRLVDIPLSRPLLKLMCGGDLSDAVYHHRSCSFVCISRGSDDDLTPTEPMVTPPVDPWFVSFFLCGEMLQSTLRPLVGPVLNPISPDSFCNLKRSCQCTLPCSS